eukprot:1153567-Pelagomonas_calceolata.AAC.6
MTKQELWIGACMVAWRTSLKPCILICARVNLTLPHAEPTKLYVRPLVGHPTLNATPKELNASLAMLCILKSSANLLIPKRKAGFWGYFCNNKNIFHQNRNSIPDTKLVSACMNSIDDDDLAPRQNTENHRTFLSEMNAASAHYKRCLE